MNVLCSVCLAPRSTQVMIPAKTSCPDSWTKEYEGYLMSSYISDMRSSYICVDGFAEGVNGTKSTPAGAELYPVSGYCKNSGGLQHCPPYVDARELTCVVCSK
ncbi:hypothetical protein EB796_016981 [Bugula neritina]|uniref:Uncharacterized protein n=1 Tax=Bugula neritina TaxID=10212 RepID=A0A7J7JEP1_BUGNE|nr:hypothetical protein EB796_016981 [Bugula neritina]